MFTSRQQNRFQRRLRQTLSDRFNKHGCSRCGAQPYHGAVFIIGGTAVVCSGCCQPTDAVSGFIALIEEGPPARDDRAWFKANPDAPYRVRPIMYGEAEEIAAREAMLSRLNGLDRSARFNSSADTVAVVPMTDLARTRRLIKLHGLSDAERVALIRETVEEAREGGLLALDASRHNDDMELFATRYAATVMTVGRLLGTNPLLDEIDRKGAAMREARKSSKH